MPRTAAIVVVGNEILSGEVADENSQFLARGLTELGIQVASMCVIPDSLDDIVTTLRSALETADLVLVTGGIGPTHDDVTREAVARVMGVGFERHTGAEASYRAAYGDSITPAELAMADLPAGSRLLTGKHTGCVGFGIDRLHVFPGIPRLLHDLFASLADEWGSEALYREEVRTKLREGRIADGLRVIQHRFPAVGIGSYPVRTDDGYLVRIVLRSPDRDALAAARSRVTGLIAELET